MTSFLIAAALLVVATLLMLLRPWRRGTADRAEAAAATTRDINAGIYRDQLQELDRDLAAGTLAAADHAQARAELQRRLLDDAGSGVAGAAQADAPAAPGRASGRTRASTRGPVVPAAAGGSRATTWGIALVVPLLAGSIYALLGEPAALDERARQGVTQGDVEKMVEGLAARLEKNPDPKGFAVLARSYRVMGRMQDAQAAFARIGPELDRDPGLLAEYADTLASGAQGSLEGKPLELVARALSIDPNHPMSLALAATAAFNRKDLKLAASYWERMLPQLPPESDDAKWVANRLAEIRGAPGGAGGDAAGRAVGDAAPAAGDGSSADTSIRGRLSLAPELAAAVLPTDTVFVFARATKGPRMPIAVQRARASPICRSPSSSTTPPR